MARLANPGVEFMPLWPPCQTDREVVNRYKRGDVGKLNGGLPL